jgi:hypothetical protein
MLLSNQMVITIVKLDYQHVSETDEVFSLILLELAFLVGGIFIVRLWWVGCPLWGLSIAMSLELNLCSWHQLQLADGVSITFWVVVSILQNFTTILISSQNNIYMQENFLPLLAIL